MSYLISFIVGILFSLGLGISGMTQPQKVVGFLDIFGNWDLSLAFVMIGAILVHALSYKLITKRPSPLLDRKWYIPNKRELTWELILGSLLFGVGWGLAGYCPGPALTALAGLSHTAILFVISMIAGMFLYALFEKVRSRA